MASSIANALITDGASLITDSKVPAEWQECDGSTLLEETNGNFDAEHLEANGCAYREAPAIAGELYKLTCGVSSLKYSSITLAFHNDAGDTLAKEVEEIFENVDGGAFSVELLAPANTTTAAVGIYGLAGSGFQDCTLQLSTPPTEPVDGSIVGTTWFDENVNGVRDSGENVIPSTQASLIFNGEVIEVASTNAKGRYYFGGLDLGACYQVQFTPADATLEITVAGQHSVADSSGITADICLTDTTRRIVQNAGFKAVEPVVEPADYAVCGRTWFTDGDSTQRAYLSNVKAILTEQTTLTRIVKRTDDTGRYVFGDLPAGDYQLRVVAPDGHTFIPGNTAENAASSFVGANGKSQVFSLPADGNTREGHMCTLGWANAGLNRTAVALEPTIANDDEVKGVVGEDLMVSILLNDEACDAVGEVNLLGHNVPGNVVYDNTTGAFNISAPTASGTYSIEYGLRGACGSYDTATVTVTIEEVPVVAPNAPPPVPQCYASIGTADSNLDKLHIDLYESDELPLEEFATAFNFYDADMVLQYTGLNSEAVRRATKLAFKNGIHGIDSLNIAFVTALENGLESAPTECVVRNVTPIALDIDGSGHVESIAGTFSFDISGDGFNETLMEWFNPTDGILVNKHFGKVMSGEHMYGDVGGTYANGYAKLALEDANKDGQIAGAELNNLAIWTDGNSNARVDNGEISSVESHSIESLPVEHYKYSARATLKNGSTMLMRDLWFASAPINQASK